MASWQAPLRGGEAASRRRQAYLSEVMSQASLGPPRRHARRPASRAACIALPSEVVGAPSTPTRRLAEDGCSFSEDFTVRCYEVGPARTATLFAVANLLQETAADHAQALWGAGCWTPSLMREQRIAFVLSKMSIRMDTALQWGSTVRVTTWFQEAGTLAARRDWVVSDAQSGVRLGAATSTWLAFNLDTRRMARLPPALRTYFVTASPSPARFALGEAHAPEKLPELGPDTACLVSSRARVRRCDLDMNHHVNNASYLAWIMDDVPETLFQTALLESVDLEYRAECNFGDEIVSKVSLVHPDGSCLLPEEPLGGESLSFRHSLARASDGTEVLRARTCWRPHAAAHS